jgi:CheY-like chemotaxis protein
MELFELARDQASHTQKSHTPADQHALLSQLGCEVARSLSAAVERVTALAATGRIDRSSLRALREEVDQARRAGIIGQQIGRLASGKVRVTRERIDLTGLLVEALRQHKREIEARGFEVRQFFAQAEVMTDATLGFALLQSVLDWALEHAVSRIDLKLDIKPWPTHARLSCSFTHGAMHHPAAGDASLLEADGACLETMSWCLVQQTAAVLGLVMYSHDTRDRTTLTLEFTDTVVPRIDGLSISELEDPSQHARNSQPLAGRHALVVASRRETRGLVRDALRPMGLMIDFVNSVEEAIEFCRDGLPHAVVYEAALTGERFEKLRADMLAEVPTMAFVQIAETGRAFEVLNLGSHQFASVGRDALLESLPAAMMFELARSESGAPQ